MKKEKSPIQTEKAKEDAIFTEIWMFRESLEGYREEKNMIMKKIFFDGLLLHAKNLLNFFCGEKNGSIRTYNDFITKDINIFNKEKIRKYGKSFEEIMENINHHLNKLADYETREFSWNLDRFRGLFEMIEIFEKRKKLPYPIDFSQGDDNEI